MRNTAWLGFITAVAVCVYVDAWRRGARFTGLFWAAAAWLLSLVVVPLWYAKRPLKALESRRGGIAVNAWHGFSVIWAAAISFQAVIILLEGRVIFAVTFWYLSMLLWYLVAAAVSHFITRDTIEHAPEGRMLKKSDRRTRTEPTYQEHHCRLMIGRVGTYPGPWSTFTPPPPDETKTANLPSQNARSWSAHHPGPLERRRP